jgi:hypothetical protein
MNIEERVALLVKLGNYMQSDDAEWQATKALAYRENAWFIPEFIELATSNIATAFLAKDKLEEWVKQYNIKDENAPAKTVGLVMAGNIPLVGFHDFLCVFVSGHHALIKASSKDAILIKHLVRKMYEWEVTIQNMVSFAEQLKNCDAYIATGSNNSGRYFEYYFSKYPHIIRKNRTSVAVLDGNETAEELSLLADDMQLYFGLGCRNVTKLYVPENYNFEPLLDALKKYDSYLDFHKYKHNFDYQLALVMMNNKFYMSSGAVVLTENNSYYSPVSQVHYNFYTGKNLLNDEFIEHKDELQCVVGHDYIVFGNAQVPSLNDYADGVDTMQFLCDL